MLDKVIRHLRKRAQWSKHARKMHSLRTPEVFQKYFEDLELKPPYVLDGAKFADLKRGVAEDLLDRNELDVGGRRVLDLGPGCGDFLDVCRERGAMTVGFDFDPFIVRWMQLRGHIGVRGNLLRSLAGLHDQLFEVVNSNGSIVVEYFHLLGLGKLRGFLDTVEAHTALGGTIMITPQYEHVPNAPQRTRKISEPLNCPFAEVMQGAGYGTITDSAANSDPCLAVTYVKTLPAT